MKRTTCFTIFTCLFLAGLIVFNSISLPVASRNKILAVCSSDHGVRKSVCDFPMEEKEGKEKSGRKNTNSQPLIYSFEQESLIKCEKLRFLCAYHIPDLLLSTEKRPLYLAYRSILI